jgi:hypothetical protein
MIAKLQKFILALLDPKGVVSFGRFTALLITCFVLGWDTSYLVFAWKFNHHLPAGAPLLSLFPDAITMGAQIAFMTVFYGVTKYGDITLGRAEPAAAAPPVAIAAVQIDTVPK